eukprot:11650964-Ditylum_brightwellii.AAC.1
MNGRVIYHFQLILVVFLVLHVDKFKYPPPVAGLKKLPSTDSTWKKLSNDIQYSLHESGSPLVLNGSNGVCCCMDRREDGISKPKKTMTHLSLVQGQCCPFKVVVKWDDNGAGKNFLYSKLGKYLSDAKVAYIQKSTPKEPLHPSLKMFILMISFPFLRA